MGAGAGYGIGLFSIQWATSHVDLFGTEAGGQVSGTGLGEHWAYPVEWVREGRQQQGARWRALGLQDMKCSICRPRLRLI